MKVNMPNKILMKWQLVGGRCWVYKLILEKSSIKFWSKIKF